MRQENNINIVIGTGRCGTVSMAYLLNGKHELRPILPWEKDPDTYKEHVKKMKKRDEDSFIALYYLRYLEDLEQDFDDLRVICLKRDKEATVDSFMKVSGGRLPEGKEYHRWTNHDGSKYNTSKWDKAFPNFIGTKRECIEKYWDKYYEIAEQYTKSDKFKILPMNYALNTKKGQKEVLEFFGKEFKGFKKYHKNT